MIGSRLKSTSGQNFNIAPMLRSIESHKRSLKGLCNSLFDRSPGTALKHNLCRAIILEQRPVLHEISLFMLIKFTVKFARWSYCVQVMLPAKDPKNSFLICAIGQNMVLNKLLISLRVFESGRVTPTAFQNFPKSLPIRSSPHKGFAVWYRGHFRLLQAPQSRV